MTGKKTIWIRFVIIGVIYISIITGYAAWSYRRESSVLLRGIDQRLLTMARTLKHIIPEGFNDRARANAVSPEENRWVVDTLSAIRDAEDLRCLYTLLKNYDHRRIESGPVIFSAAEITPEERANGRESWHLEPYTEMPQDVKYAFDRKQPTYMQLSDRWGTTRVVLVPEKTPKGETYLACADVDLGYIQGLLNTKLIEAIITAVAFLILPLPLFLLYIKQHRVAVQEAQKSEKEIRKREEQLMMALKAGELGTWDWDITSDIMQIRDNYVNMYDSGNLANKGDYMEMTSYKGWYSLIHPDDLESVKKEMDDHFNGVTEYFRSEYRIFNKKLNKEIWLYDQGQVIEWDAHGKAARSIGIYMDITARKNAEEERAQLEDRAQQTQKIETVGRLAGGIAHDFNNMLTGIMASTELLILEIPKEHKNLLDYTNAIMDISEKAGKLIRQLLDFSRQGRVVSTSFDIHEVINLVCEILYRVLDKRIHIKTELNATNSTIIGDPAQIQNSFLNLGINAGDAMARGGALTISTSNITAENTPSIEITVTDTGVGIAEDQIERVFEPFFTTKEVGKGTGLGLSAVYGTITDHNGQIKIRSRENEGATFIIRLPVCSLSLNSQAVKKISPISIGSGCILIVDDEPVTIAMAERILSKMGYEVLSASNGEKALVIFEAHKDRISLVILDMIMPKLGGLDTFIALRYIKPDVKVLIASGYSNDEEIREMMLRGAAGFIRKPFRTSEIGREIAGLIG